MSAGAVEAGNRGYPRPHPHHGQRVFSAIDAVYDDHSDEEGEGEGEVEEEGDGSPHHASAAYEDDWATGGGGRHRAGSPAAAPRSASPAAGRSRSPVAGVVPQLGGPGRYAADTLVSNASVIAASVVTGSSHSTTDPAASVVSGVASTVSSSASSVAPAVPSLPSAHASSGASALSPAVAAAAARAEAAVAAAAAAGAPAVSYCYTGNRRYNRRLRERFRAAVYAVVATHRNSDVYDHGGDEGDHHFTGEQDGTTCDYDDDDEDDRVAPAVMQQPAAMAAVRSPIVAVAARPTTPAAIASPVVAAALPLPAATASAAFGTPQMHHVRQQQAIAAQLQLQQQQQDHSNMYDSPGSSCYDMGPVGAPAAAASVVAGGRDSMGYGAATPPSDALAQARAFLAQQAAVDAALAAAASATGATAATGDMLRHDSMYSGIDSLPPAGVKHDDDGDRWQQSPHSPPLDTGDHFSDTGSMLGRPSEDGQFGIASSRVNPGRRSSVVHDSAHHAQAIATAGAAVARRRDLDSPEPVSHYGAAGVPAGLPAPAFGRSPLPAGRAAPGGAADPPASTGLRHRTPGHQASSPPPAAGLRTPLRAVDARAQRGVVGGTGGLKSPGAASNRKLGSPDGGGRGGAEPFSASKRRISPPPPAPHFGLPAHLESRDSSLPLPESQRCSFETAATGGSRDHLDDIGDEHAEFQDPRRGAHAHAARAAFRHGRFTEEVVGIAGSPSLRGDALMDGRLARARGDHDPSSASGLNSAQTSPSSDILGEHGDGDDDDSHGGGKLGRVSTVTRSTLDTHAAVQSVAVGQPPMELAAAGILIARNAGSKSVLAALPQNLVAQSLKDMAAAGGGGSASSAANAAAGVSASAAGAASLVAHASQRRPSVVLQAMAPGAPLWGDEEGRREPVVHPYRPSDALNEDDYDFAIVVRVSNAQLKAENARQAAAAAAASGPSVLSGHKRGIASSNSFRQPQTPAAVARKGDRTQLLPGSATSQSVMSPPKGRTGDDVVVAVHGGPQYADDDGIAEGIYSADSASESDSDDLSDSSDDQEGGPAAGAAAAREGAAGAASKKARSKSRRARTRSAGNRSSIGGALLSGIASLTAHARASVTRATSTAAAGAAARGAPTGRPALPSPVRGAVLSDDDFEESMITAPRVGRRVTWSSSQLDTGATTTSGNTSQRPGDDDSSDSDDEAARKHTASDATRGHGGHGLSTPVRSRAPPSDAMSVPPGVFSPASAATFASPRHMHKCSEILEALRTAGLFAKRVRSLSRRTWLIKIKAPEWRLELEAERIRLRMRRRDGGWSRFKRSMRGAFVPAIPAHFADDPESDDDDGDMHGRDFDEFHGPGIGGPNSGGRMGKRQSLFHSSDRQTLIDHILRSSAREGGADLGDGTPLGAFVTHMFPLHMYVRLEELRSDWLMLWRRQRSHAAYDRIGTDDPSWYAAPTLVDVSATGVPKRSHFDWWCRRSSSRAAQEPLASKIGTAATAPTVAVKPAGSATTGGGSGGDAPEGSAPGDAGLQRRKSCCSRCCGGPAAALLWSITCCCKCGRSTSRLCTGFMSQPLDRIAAYFGETVAFYFAWLQFYTQWLVVPAIAGLLVFLSQIYGGSLDSQWVPLFSLMMAAWSILFLEFWKRKNARLAQRWGVLAYEDEEVVRPQFHGAWKQDVATGNVIRVYPRWKRCATYLVTVPIILAFIAGIMIFMVFVFSTRDQVLAQVNSHERAVAAHEAWVTALNGTTTEVAAITADLPTIPALSIDIKASMVHAWEAGVLGFITGSTGTLNALGGFPSTAPAGASNTTAAYIDAINAAATVTGTAAMSDTSVAVVDSSADSTTADKLSWAAVQERLSRFETLFSRQHDWRWWIAMIVPPVIYGVIMPVFDSAFNRVALAFNDRENHATESAYRNNRIAKVFFYRFISSFVSLFYYAFSPQHSMLALFIQLGAFMVVGQILKGIVGILAALLGRCWRECQAATRVRSAEDSGLTEGRRGRRLLRHAQSAAWVEGRMPVYDTFNDYAVMLIQFGYVTFFSWGFPLAPLCALVNNVIEMRRNAYKLCYLSQRPIAFKAGGIGVWHNVLSSMSILAVLTNCAHLALTSKQFTAFFPGMTDVQRLLLVFVFEHIVLALRLLMAYIIPPTPASVERRRARDAWALAKLQGRRSAGDMGGERASLPSGP